MWTLVLPVVPIMLAIDGIVSVMRAYRRDELRLMAEAAGNGFAWEYGTVRYLHVFEGSYLMGHRQSRSARFTWSEEPKQRRAAPGGSASSVLTHERLSRLVLGITILVGMALGFWLSPWFYLIPVFSALNLLKFSITGACAMKSLFDRMGVRYEMPPDDLVIHARSDDSVEAPSSPRATLER